VPRLHLISPPFVLQEKESVDSVSVGAILSDYQRVRVENVCQRLHLQPLAFLWRRRQEDLLDEMTSRGLQAVLIKVAAFGLEPDKHLGKTLEEIRPHLKQLSCLYGVHVCGEGGEYETLTLDCPLFKKRIVVDSADVVMHSDDAFAPVAYLRLLKLHLEDKVVSPKLDSQGGCPCMESCIMEPVPCVAEEYDDTEHQCVTWTPRPLPFVPSCNKMGRSTRSLSGFQWVSGVTARAGNVRDASLRGFTSLQDRAAELGLQLRDVVLLHLYVRSMEDFAAINTVYATLFPEAPPARVCVQCTLPGDAFFQVDCLFWQPAPLTPCSEDSIPEKIAMHVQSISHWAPANIGPYSQSVRISAGVFCAGQIALIPCTMQLLPGGIAAEVGISLRHVERVLDATSPGTTLSHAMVTHCYVTRASYIPTAAAAWHRRHAQTHQDRAPLLTVAVVPQLPRGAAVEWHVMAAADEPAERRHFSLSEASSGFQVTLRGVISSSASCASLVLSLCVASARLPSQDWCGALGILGTALRRASGELSADTALTALCCRSFCKGDSVESQSLREGLQELLEDVWGEKAPVLVLVPVLDLSGSEILHLSFWFSS
ncbi:uncharacterized protein LOC142486024, partial [Ascaphus truei]|uniref:uncharacterized protein LOC142486024 n=1 Tax=Ascaphus truei TaxID=8439 RepID=UPI003F596F17